MFWCGVKLPFSSSGHHTLSKGRRRGDEQMERKPILKDDGSRNPARLLSTSLAAKSSVSASAQQVSFREGCEGLLHDPHSR